MKTIFTLVAAITFSLFVFGQTSSNTFSTPELQKRFEQINSYNTMLREQGLSNRQTPTIKLDSIISWRYDSILNSWYELEKSTLTFYPNGIIKTWKGYSIEYIGESNYNSNGYLTSSINYKYEFGYWVKSHKNEITYDGSFNKIESLSYKGVGNNWVLSYKENWTYDSSSNLITHISYQIQGGTSTNQFKKEYTYNSSNLETSKAEYYWANGGWYHGVKTERGYDANGNEILNTIYYGDATSWKPNSKGVTTFTSFNKPEMKLSYSWDTIQVNWIISDSSWAVYNADSLLQSDTTFRWYNASWKYSLLQENVYDNNKNVILNEQKGWDWNYWRNYVKDEAAYDADNRRIYWIRRYWNFDNDYWMNQYKFESYYSASGDSAYGIRSFGQDSLWVKSDKGVNYFDINISVDEVTPRSFFWVEPFQLLSSKYFFQKNGQWSLGDSTNYYYSNLLTGVESISNNDLLIYPNPTTDYLNITGDFGNEFQVEISDISGKIIRFLPSFDSTTRMNVQGLSPGVYFMRISDGDITVVKKLVKQ